MYAEGDIYPYHMPGHKRQKWGELPEAMFKTDITEIEGFDNLHQPEGILLELQREAAGLYGSEECYYLVNGSTCGILSALSGAVLFGGRILMARNCHKSAYHAAYLRHLKISYLYPHYLETYGIADAVTSEQVRSALEAESDIQAVLIVSPTYEGRIADISRIAGIVHERGIPLIVDEAHGAHLGLAEGFPPNSCQAGADLVIHSVHKTLPSLTQTALLHVNGNLVDRDRLCRFLHIYQTSSPSYLLMAGIDNALEYVRQQGGTAFRQFRERYDTMMEALSVCSCLKFLSGDNREQDTGKLVISVRHAGITGKQLSDILLKEYHLQTEMSSGDYALAMFTVNDSEEAYRRMTEALLEIDSRVKEQNIDESFAGWHEDSPEIYRTEFLTKDALSKKVLVKKALIKQALVRKASKKKPLVRKASVKKLLVRKASEKKFLVRKVSGKKLLVTSFLQEARGQFVLDKRPAAEEEMREPIPLAEAWDMESEEVALKDSVGKHAAEFVNLYPPGVPLLVPGERMTEGLYQEILRDLEAELTVQGIRVEAGNEPFPERAFIRLIR